MIYDLLNLQGKKIELTLKGILSEWIKEVRNYAHYNTCDNSKKYFYGLMP
jgi:hypothetical protein